MKLSPNVLPFLSPMMSPLLPLMALSFVTPRPALAQAIEAAPVSENCPVSLHALQGLGSGLLAVREGKPTQGPGQHIHLVVSDAKASRVTGAKVLVSGLTGSHHVVPTRSPRDNKPDATRMLDLRFVPQDANEVAAELILPGFTSVRSIAIQSIEYDDGSTWTVAAHQACLVAPDPMMLIADR